MAQKLAAVRHWTRRDDGQDLLEYGLLASLIAMFVISALSLVGERLDAVFWAPIGRAF